MDLQNPTPEELLCDESFLRYCRGEHTADMLFWQHWIATHPEQRSIIQKALQLYDLLSAGQGNRFEQLAELKDAMARKERFAALIGNTPVRVFTLKKKIAYAAAVAILITGGILGFIKYPHQSTWSLSRYEYTTGPGSRQTIILPDRSMVMLNENSHLVISKDFREVTLSGEGFFDIQHDAAHPFLVHTKDYHIRVLGTSFNVKAYPGMPKTETDLVSGKVEIMPVASHKVMLRPNEKFVLEPAATAAIPKKGTITNLYVDTLTHRIVETAWTRTKIDITDETLEQIAQQLEAWYGIRISFTSEAVKKYRYTASFEDETIFKALQYLQQSYPFTYRIEQDSIIISGS